MSLTDTFDNPQSRVEAILQNAMGADHEVVPQSRVEELLERLDGYLENIEGKITDQDEEIIAAVNAWLEDNPEATTTVQDGSLTYKKLVTGTLGFVTPEMFGAVGDGVTDDTDAIQQAFNSGFPVSADKTYKINSSLYITGNNIKIDLTNTTLVYSGSDSAIIIQGANGGDIKFGRITAVYGNGIEFRADTTAHRSQYINLHFLAIQCGDKGIYVNVTGGWCNEINVYGGVFITSGNYGVYFSNNPSVEGNSINSWKLYTMAGEVSDSFVYVCVNSPNYNTTGITIFYPRYYEFTNSILLQTIGYANSIDFYGNSFVTMSRFDLSNTSKRIYIHAPVESDDKTVLLGESAKFHYGTMSYLNYIPVSVVDIVNSLVTSSRILPQTVEGTGEIRVRKVGKVATVYVDGFKPTNAASELLVEEMDSDYRTTNFISFMLKGSDGSVKRAFVRPNGLIGCETLTGGVVYNGSVTYQIS